MRTLNHLSLPLHLLILWLGILLPGGLSAQYQSIQFNHLGPTDGLSQSTVRAICQDRFGFMWFGTYDGLNKYDGQKFVFYRHDDQDTFSIPSNIVYDVYEDRSQQLWFTTRAGLCYLDRASDRFLREYPDSTQKDARFVEVAEDGTGALWLSGTHGTMYRRSLGESDFRAFRNPYSDEYINEFILLRNGKVWLSSADNSLYELDPSTGEYTVLLSGLINEIISFYEDPNDVIWVGTSNEGIRTFDQKTGNWGSILHDPADPNSLPNNVVWDIMPGQDNELLFATNGGLAILYLDENWQEPSFRILQYDSSDPYSIGSNFAYRLYKGNDQLIWIGTIDSGLSIWDRKAQLFNHIYAKASAPDGLNNNVIWHFEEDEKGNFWIGTSKGLNYFNRTSGQVQHYVHEVTNSNSLPDNRVWQILKVTDQHYWVGTTRGVTKMILRPNGPPQFTTYYPSEASGYSFGTVRQLVLDHRNQLWVGTSNGLFIFDPGSATYRGFFPDTTQIGSINSNDIRSIYEDSRQQLWIGTRGGLNRYDQSTGLFTSYEPDPEDSTSLNHRIVRTIIEDQKGRLWLGTGKGLNEMIPAQSPGERSTFRHFTLEDGLPNETIYSMEVDEQGFIWLSTNNGLSKFSPENHSAQNFHPHLGLQSHEFNSDASLKTRDGKLLFGGINGFNFFDPQNVPTDRNNYPMVFTDLKVNYKTVGPDSRYLDRHINLEDEIRLVFAEDKMFYLEFTVLDLLHSDTRQFAYRLLPFDSDWNEGTGNNHAAYTNISPGEYAFQVRSADRNGVWSEVIGEVNVQIEPAFWQTNWFRLLSLGLIIGLIYFIYRYRTRSIRQQQLLLEKVVEERTTQIQQQKKALEQTLSALQDTQSKLVESEKMASLGQLTAGIAHELNNPVSFISGNAEALRLDFEEIRQVLQAVLKLEESPENSEQIQQLLDLSHQLDVPFLLEEMSTLIQDVKMGSGRISDIVNGLKIFTHQSTGDFPPEDLEPIVDSALIILQNKIKKKDIQVIKSWTELPKIPCLAGKLNQVFVNIIANSIDAMSTNGELRISAALEEEQVLIRVQDDGKGMDEATRKHLFEPFFTTKEVGAGTGLGLYISYGIIQQHGGTIAIESTLGQGSNFLIRLPLQHS